MPKMQRNLFSVVIVQIYLLVLLSTRACLETLAPYNNKGSLNHIWTGIKSPYSRDQHHKPSAFITTKQKYQNTQTNWCLNQVSNPCFQAGAFHNSATRMSIPSLLFLFPSQECGWDWHRLKLDWSLFFCPNTNSVWARELQSYWWWTQNHSFCHLLVECVDRWRSALTKIPKNIWRYCPISSFPLPMSEKYTAANISWRLSSCSTSQWILQWLVLLKLVCTYKISAS